MLHAFGHRPPKRNANFSSWECTVSVEEPGFSEGYSLAQGKLLSSSPPLEDPVVGPSFVNCSLRLGIDSSPRSELGIKRKQKGRQVPNRFMLDLARR